MPNSAKTEAIEAASAHLQNAGLPTYAELVAALQMMTSGATRPIYTDSCGQPMVKMRAAAVDAARAVLARAI